MKRVLSVAQSRNADKMAIEQYSIPGIVLMENAARSARDIILAHFPCENFRKILILCGRGNNGGDGFALARHLSFTHSVTIYRIGESDRMSEETRTNFESALSLELPVFAIENAADVEKLSFKFDCIVDALTGVGGSEKLTGVVVDLLKRANKAKAVKVAIDVPSGLNSDSGLAHEHAFKADLTVTMFGLKHGIIRNDGLELCGEIEVANLGAPDFIVNEIARDQILTESSASLMMPRRFKKSNKFSYGKTAIIAGSEQFPGAAILAANAAIKSGAGLVYLLTNTDCNSLLPEVIPVRLPSNSDGGISEKAFDVIDSYTKKCSSVAIGPGLSASEETISLVAKIINESQLNTKLIIDADAVRAINPKQKYTPNMVITPHAGEFASLTGMNINDIVKSSFEVPKAKASEMQCIVHLKEFPAITTNGSRSYIHYYGNPGMATAGSGDVLTGLIAGLAAQGMELIEATSLAAYLHASAGDIYADENNMWTLTASSLIDYLPKAFNKLK